MPICDAHNRSKPGYSWILCISITLCLTLVYMTYLFGFAFNFSFGGKQYHSNRPGAPPTTTGPNFHMLLYSTLVLFPSATWIYVMVVLSYWKTALTDPGKVPVAWSITRRQLGRIQDGNYEHMVERMHQQHNMAMTGADASHAGEDLVDEADQNVEDGGSMDSGIGSGGGSSVLDMQINQSQLSQRSALQQQEQEKYIMDSNSSVLLRTEEKTRDGRIRACQICLVRKPDRTHHCSQCGRCVLKMDHHCVFVNNCVGFHNYKFFFLFLLYMVAGSAFFCLTVSVSFFRILKLGDTRSDNVYIPSFSEIALLIAFIVSFVFGIALVLFGFFHFRLILFNNTTLEYMEKRTKFRKLEGTPNPYDISILYNLRSVFGKEWYLWFIPVANKSMGDGTLFKRRAHITGLIRDRNAVHVHSDEGEDDNSDDDIVRLAGTRNSFGGTWRTPILP